jgi:hypothetical protein
MRHDQLIEAIGNIVIVLVIGMLLGIAIDAFVFCDRVPIQ